VFVNHLEGQFAIAIYDHRSGTILLYRDRFGIRPLFWARHGDMFLFGSEIKSLITVDGFQVSLSHRALVQTGLFWTTVGDETAFQEVKQLPPGHILKYHDGNVTLSQYWNIFSLCEVDRLNLKGDEDYLRAFRSEFDAAVDRQSMGDVEVGSYLSGGVDSSVVAHRRSVRNGPLRTYSISFSDAEYDESKSQRTMADENNFIHTSVQIGYEDIVRNFYNVQWHAESILFRSAPVPLFLLSERVKQDGLKVVLTGEGADEMLFGYDLFRETKIRRFLARDPQSANRGKLFSRLYSYLPQYKEKRFLGLLIDFYAPTLLSDSHHYPMQVRWNNGRNLSEIFSSEVRNGKCDPIADLEKYLPRAYYSSNDLQKAQAVECATLLPNYLLSSQGDRMSMGNSVEGRYPFLDDKFVKFMASLPERLKLRGLKDKWILRNAFKESVPESICFRPKVAYQAPDMKAFFSSVEGQDLVRTYLSDARIKSLNLFDPMMVRKIIRKGESLSAMPRVSMRDNMSFIMLLSTMMIEDIFVKKNHLSFSGGKKISVEYV